MTFLPHGYCFAWATGLLWSMAGADALIALAYFSIPLAIVTVVRRRGDSSLNSLAWLFTSFIFACGLTHAMDVWTIWQPYYRLQTFFKIVTAAMSLMTAFVLWRLIPALIGIPTPRDLHTATRSFEEESRRRQQVEEWLSDAQQSLAATLASIEAAFISTDRVGRISHMNTVAERLTGWQETEARGRALAEVFVPADRPAHLGAANPVDLLMARGSTAARADRFALLARDGGSVPVELRSDLTHAQDGGVRGMVLVFRDLSRLQRAEAQANRLAAIVENSEDAIIGKTLHGRIISWNRGAEAMFGYSAAQMTGESVFRLIPPQRMAEERHVLALAARGENVPAFDTARIGSDGGLRQVSVTVSPIRDAAGLIVGVASIARDVARQRRAEEALRDSERRLRFTLEAARLGAWEVDLPEGAARGSALCARCFGHAEEIRGWSLQKLIGQIHPQDRAQVEAALARHIAAATGFSFECRVVWPDESVHWISSHGSVVEQNGAPARIFGIVTDITEQKAGEEWRQGSARLEQENLRIQEANRMKNLFLANMSHELRTPLNAIIGFSDLLQTGAIAADSAKHREFLGYIGTSGRHLLQLINDVLDLSKVESGKFQFLAEPVRLSSLLKEVGEVLHTALQRRQIVLVADIDPAVEDVVVDPARMKQVLYNFLSNAIKFSHEGGRVTVRARPQGPEDFRIEVEDHGIGIAAADLPRLFTEFQQLDGGLSRRHQGTGLGLALTRRLVEAQGGSVGVHSVPGRGSVFHVTLGRDLSVRGG